MQKLLLLIAFLLALVSPPVEAHHSEIGATPVVSVCDAAENDCSTAAAAGDTSGIRVLTFHSAQFSGCDANTHPTLALESLLETLQRYEWTVVPLSWVVDYLLEKRQRESLPEKAVVITFDDRFYLDVIDGEYDYCAYKRGVSTPSVLRVLREFKERHPQLPYGSPHVTLFITAAGLESYYLEAALEGEREGLLEIGSHTLSHARLGGVNTLEEADREIHASTLQIFARTGVCPSFFAYPYGEASDYLVREYLPSRHGCLAAAFSTECKAVSREDNHWFLPRCVWSWDWTSERQLLLMLGERVEKIPQPPSPELSR